MWLSLLIVPSFVWVSSQLCVSPLSPSADSRCTGPVLALTIQQAQHQELALASGMVGFSSQMCFQGSSLHICLSLSSSYCKGLRGEDSDFGSEAPR